MEIPLTQEEKIKISNRNILNYVQNYWKRRWAWNWTIIFSDNWFDTRLYVTFCEINCTWNNQFLLQMLVTEGFITFHKKK